MNSICVEDVDGSSRSDVPWIKDGALYHLKNWLRFGAVQLIELDKYEQTEI